MPVSIEVEKVRSEIFEAIDDLRQEFIASHKQVDHPVKQQDSQVVNVGNNSAEAFKWIVFALISLIAGTAYLIYIGGWNHHHGEADPPQLPIIENPAQ